MSTYAYESGHSVRTQAYVFIVTFGLGMIVARALGPGPRGVLALAQQVFTLAVMFGGLGVHASVRYWIARSPDDRQPTLARATGLTLITSLLSAGIYAAAYATLGGNLLAGVPTPVMVLFGVTMLVNLVTALLTALVYGDGDVVGANQAGAIALTVRAVVIGAFLASGLTIDQVVVAALAMEVAASVYLWRRARARLGRMPIAWPKLSGTTSMVRYGVKAMASNVLQWLNYRADIFLLASMRPESEVGRYAVAVTIAEILMRGSAALSRPLFPRVARDQLSGEVTARASRAMLVVLTAAAVPVLAPAYLAHLFLGDAYAGMFETFLWLVPGAFAYGLGNVLHFDLQARGAVGRTSLANAASLVVNVALNLVLIPRHGMLGAAWATSIAYALNLFAVAAMFSAMNRTSVGSLWIPRRDDLRELRVRAGAFVTGMRGR